MARPHRKSLRLISKDLGRHEEQDDFTDDEIENTNSSIMEMASTKPIRHASAKDKTIIVLSDHSEADKHDVNSNGHSKRRKLDESIPVADDKVKFSESWVERYAPKTVDKIAMHPKKLLEVEAALRGMVSGKSSDKILLLTGPSGSGKSTAIKLLTDKIFQDLKRHDMNIAIDHSTENYIEFASSTSYNVVDEFTEFLNQCKMLTGPNLKVILVEDLPNVIHLETKLKFQRALQDYLDVPYRLPPLCICLTENEFNDELGGDEKWYNIQNNFVAETVIGTNILNSSFMRRIKVNPIAKTYLKKALLNIIKQETYVFSSIPKVVVEEKLQTFCINGDIRSVINCLEFWAKYFKYTATRDDDLLSFGKENNLNLFNAVGKVVYGTSHEDAEIVNYQKANGMENSNVKSEQIDKITVSNVVSNYSNKCAFFNLNLLENYSMLNSGEFSVCQELDKMCNDMSLADVLNGAGLPDAGISVSVASARYSLRDIDSKIKDGSLGTPTNKISRFKNQKLIFSRSFRSKRLQRQVMRDIESYQLWTFQKSALSQSTAALDDHSMSTWRSKPDSIMIDGFYEPVIFNSRRNEDKLRKRLMHTQQLPYIPESMIPKLPRLGGPFKDTSTGSFSAMSFDDDYQSFKNELKNFQTLEEKLLTATTDRFTNGEQDDGGESEFSDDPIDDEEGDEKVDASSSATNGVTEEILADLNDDDSFENEDYW